MAIKELCEIIEPPKFPLDAERPCSWKAVERRLSTPLPRDWRDFALTFGTGSFISVEHGIHFQVINPLNREIASIWQEWCSTLIARLEEYPFDAFPFQPGLMTCAWDDQGWQMCWLTEGAPDEWPIFAKRRNAKTWSRYDMSMTTFLARVLKGEIRPPIWKGVNLRRDKNWQFVPGRGKAWLKLSNNDCENVQYREFERHGGDEDRFFYVRLDKKRIETQFGHIGKKGKSVRHREYKNEKQARIEFEKLSEAKSRDGFFEIGSRPA